MAFQPREWNTLIGCSKRLTEGHRVKARVGYSFFIGVLVYRIYRNNAKRPQFRGVLSWVIAGCHLHPGDFGLDYWPDTAAAAQLAVVAMLFPTLNYFGACVHLSQRWDNISFFLGEMSYPLYLLHIPLFLPLYGHVFQRLFALHPGLTLLVLPIVVPVYVLISWWVAKHYDRPARRLLTRRYNAAVPVAVSA